MARKAVEATALVASWDEANKTLKRICELTILKRIREDKALLRINEIRERLGEDCKSLNEELKTLEAGLKLFAEAEQKKTNFKTKLLDFGSIFFRKSSKLKLARKFTWEGVIECLRAAGRKDLLRETVEVNKDAVKAGEFTDEELVRWGMVIDETTPFKYELNEERLAELRTTESVSDQASAA